MRFFIFISFILTLNLFYSCVTNKSLVQTDFNSGINKKTDKSSQRWLKKIFKRNNKLLNENDSVVNVFDPDVDTDGDGILDYEDKCPTVFGAPENMGCPKISMEVKEVAAKQLSVQFEYVLVSSWEDMLNKNPKFVHLESDWPTYYEEVASRFNPIRHNLELVEQLWFGGCISNKVYEDYNVRVNKGEVFELDLSECGMYEYGKHINSPSNDNVSYISNVENMDIIDNANADSNSSKGTIAYSVPKEMLVGKQYIIKLRITKEKGKKINQTLILGDRNIPISDVNVDSKVTIENIRVEKTMTAQLISEDGNFKVTPQNTDKQVIEDNEYTEWGWLVTPLKSGKTYLKLIIKIKIDADGEVTYKDIVVFDKDIEVKPNASLEVKSWLSEYWQWLMTTIIIPLIVFLYKNRKNKEEQK